MGEEGEFPNEQERAKKVENGRGDDVGVFTLMLASILRCRRG